MDDADDTGEAERAAGSSKRRKLVRVLAVSLALPVLGAIGTVLYVAWVGRQADATLADLVEEGVVSDPAAVWTDLSLSSTDATKAFRKALRTLDTERMLSGDGTPGGESSGATELAACNQVLKSLREHYGRRLPDEELLARFSQPLSSVFARLEQAEPNLDRALQADALVFENVSLGFPGDLSFLAVRMMQTALRARSVRAAVSGDLDAAWADLARYLRLTRLLWCRGLVNGYGRRLATNDGVELLEQLLPLGPPSPQRLKAIRGDLEALEDPKLLQRALGDDVIWGLAFFDSMLGNEAAEAWLVVRGYPTQKVSGLLRFPLRRDRAVFVRRSVDRLRYLGSPTPAVARRRLAALGDPPTAWVPGGEALLSEGHMDIMADFEDRTRVRLALVALDLVAKGEDLPLRLTDPPVDPCSPDHPIHWRRSVPRSGLLWSVGNDGQDDQGARPPNKINTSPHGPGVDVVFHLDLPPR